MKVTSCITVLLALAVLVEYIIGLPKIFEFNYNWYGDYNFKNTVESVYETDDFSNGCCITIEPENWSMWLPKEKILATHYGIRKYAPLSENVYLADLTDVNWENGVNRNAAIMLFKNNRINVYNLLYYEHGRLYTDDNKSVNIQCVQKMGDWIWVTVDDYEECKEIAKGSKKLYVGECES